MLGEALDESTSDHNQRAKHDGPPTSISLGEPWRDGDCEDGTELIAGVDETKQARLDSIFALDHATTAHVYIQPQRQQLMNKRVAKEPYTSGRCSQTAAC